MPARTMAVPPAPLGDPDAPELDDDEERFASGRILSRLSLRDRTQAALRARDLGLL
ncbi:hypothetical protein [Streptomyces sviceus]|uniref:hypothetical protein n=1 Tax=Streptomyces sviceus TaxID=285530 RepID=UPI0036E37019